MIGEALRRISLSRYVTHAVLGEEHACSGRHGHSLRLSFTATAPAGLDAVGSVVDPKVFQYRVNDWLDHAWGDGAVVHSIDDETMRADVEQLAELDQPDDPYRTRSFVMPYNPTFENMARYLGEVVCPSILSDLGVVVVKVEIEEADWNQATSAIWMTAEM